MVGRLGGGVCVWVVGAVSAVGAGSAIEHYIRHFGRRSRHVGGWRCAESGVGGVSGVGGGGLWVCCGWWGRWGVVGAVWVVSGVWVERRAENMLVVGGAGRCDIVSLAGVRGAGEGKDVSGGGSGCGGGGLCESRNCGGKEGM